MLAKLNEIADAVGNEKIKILQKYPELKQIVKAAYDPHKKYYITAPGITVAAKYGEHIFNTYGSLTSRCNQLLSDLNTRTLSGNNAKEKIADYIAGLAAESAEIFQKILDKDLRIGINTKTINKAFPGLIPAIKDEIGKPAIPLCKTYDPDKIKYPVLASIKYDGTRGRAKSGKLYSRSFKHIQGLEHIERALPPYDLDGEIIVPGKNFDASSGLVRNKKPVPDAVYMVFDADFPGGKRERHHKLLREIQAASEGGGPIQLVEQHLFQDRVELIKFYVAAIASGHEGIVICDSDGLYTDARIWWRLVPKKTADCQVVGFYEGKGKFANSLGGIIVQYKNQHVKVGSGFQELPWHKLPHTKKRRMAVPDVIMHTDTVRSQIWDNQDKYLNKIAEIEFKEETKAGSMRQPTFKYWRFDKTEPNFE